jgi:endoglucanase
MNTKQRLQELCSLSGPSGFEYPVSEKAAELMREVGMEEVAVDRMGNVVGVRRCGKPGAKKLLLDAHLDEIGLMVTGIEDGYLRFRSIGQRVIFTF